MFLFFRPRRRVLLSTRLGAVMDQVDACIRHAIFRGPSRYNEPELITVTIRRILISAYLLVRVQLYQPRRHICCPAWRHTTPALVASPKRLSRGATMAIIVDRHMGDSRRIICLLIIDFKRRKGNIAIRSLTASNWFTSGFCRQISIIGSSTWVIM